MRTQDTQLQAYDAIQPRAGSIRNQIHALVATRPEGMTCEEIEAFLAPKGHQTVSARINELMYDGYLVKGETKRLNKTGAEAIVWRYVHRDAAVPLERVEKPIRVVAKAMLAALEGLMEIIDIHSPNNDENQSAIIAQAVKACVDAKEVLHGSPKAGKRKDDAN